MPTLTNSQLGQIAIRTIQSTLAFGAIGLIVSRKYSFPKQNLTKSLTNTTEQRNKGLSNLVATLAQLCPCCVRLRRNPTMYPYHLCPRI